MIMASYPCWMPQWELHLNERRLGSGFGWILADLAKARSPAERDDGETSDQATQLGREVSGMWLESAGARSGGSWWESLALKLCHDFVVPPLWPESEAKPEMSETQRSPRILVPNDSSNSPNHRKWRCKGCGVSQTHDQTMKRS
jgi:hypothetical protein